MKLLKYIKYGILGICLFTISCNINEAPKFNDSDAFVAFTSSSLNFEENDTIVRIPVQLVSLRGVSASVSYTVVDSTALEGIDFRIVSTGSLTFSREKTEDYIDVQIIDNDEYTGDLIFELVLTTNNVNLGSAYRCIIRIIDDEHPLSDILGDYSASADSYFASRGSFAWTITLEKDDEDDTKVWIANLEPYFATNGFVAPNYNYFYGVVNEDMTEIRVPVNQALGYQGVELVGFSDPDPDQGAEMDAGENIIISILPDGNLRVENGFGAYDDGWWNIMYGNLILYKQ